MATDKNKHDSDVYLFENQKIVDINMEKEVNHNDAIKAPAITEANYSLKNQIAICQENFQNFGLLQK